MTSLTPIIELHKWKIKNGILVRPHCLGSANHKLLIWKNWLHLGCHQTLFFVNLWSFLFFFLSKHFLSQNYFRLILFAISIKCLTYLFLLCGVPHAYYNSSLQKKKICLFCSNVYNTNKLLYILTTNVKTFFFAIYTLIFFDHLSTQFWEKNVCKNMQT